MGQALTTHVQGAEYVCDAEVLLGLEPLEPESPAPVPQASSLTSGHCSRRWGAVLGETERSTGKTRLWGRETRVGVNFAPIPTVS